MKALLCTHYGTPDDLVLTEVPDPTAGEGEVVVRIHAAALNFFDTLIPTAIIAAKGWIVTRACCMKDSGRAAAEWSVGRNGFRRRCEISWDVNC